MILISDQIFSNLNNAISAGRVDERSSDSIKRTPIKKSKQVLKPLGKEQTATNLFIIIRTAHAWFLPCMILKIWKEIETNNLMEIDTNSLMGVDTLLYRVKRKSWCNISVCPYKIPRKLARSLKV